MPLRPGETAHAGVSTSERGRVRQAAPFLVAFVGLKALAFIVPVVIAGIAAAPIYGAVEVGLSFATLGAMALSSGVSASVPYYILKDPSPGALSVARLHSTVLAAAGAAAGAIGLAGWLRWEWAMSGAMLGVTASQQPAAARARAEGRVVAASSVRGLTRTA